jgi:hypothetical protein
VRRPRPARGLREHGYSQCNSSTTQVVTSHAAAITYNSHALTLPDHLRTTPGISSTHSPWAF